MLPIRIEMKWREVRQFDDLWISLDGKPDEQYQLIEDRGEAVLELIELLEDCGRFWPLAVLYLRWRLIIEKVLRSEYLPMVLAIIVILILALI